MMIRITDTPKPKDRIGSIPIRDGKQANSSLYGVHLPRQPENFFLWTWLKRIVGFLLGMAILLGVGSPLLVPYLATSILPKQLTSALNRPATIARAEFNPLNGTMTLRQLIVGPELSLPDDPVDPLLSAGKISIALDPKRLLDGEVACNLSAEHFFLHLVRQKDGGYNLGQIMDDLLPTMPVLPLRFSWKAMSLKNSRLVFDDAQTGKTHLVENLALTLSSDQAAPWGLQALINGIPVTLPGTTSSAQDPTTAKPGSGATPNDPGMTDATVKTAEAIALAQHLSQTAREYLQQTATSPDERRPSLAP
ncbi:MAG: hypothetical protein WC633_06500 [Desulfurivibrionaceae bacterium]|jgi:hypothetical protein